MELLTMLLLLTQAQAQNLGPANVPVETRIIESRGAPVTLVGLPCGDDAKKVRVEEPKDQAEPKAYLASKPFVCEKECAVGIRVKEGARVASFIVATATAHDRGRITGTLSPSLGAGAALQTCNGESYLTALMSRVNWPVNAGIIYVSDVTFQDGTSWHVNRDTLEEDVLKSWIVQPKHGQ